MLLLNVHLFFLILGSDAALSTFLMLGKAVLAALFAVVYVYAAELFPTVVRNVGVGSSSMSARVGGLLQPQIGLLVSCSIAKMASSVRIFCLKPWKCTSYREFIVVASPTSSP